MPVVPSHSQGPLSLDALDDASRSIAKHLEEACEMRGFDIVVPFDTHWYRETRPEAPSLPTFGHEDGALGWLIGNTKALWSHFLESLREHPERLDDSDPLDRWVETQIRDAIQGLDLEHRLLWAHEPDEQGDFVPFQAIAELTGLAATSPSQLAVHPEYGPWLALRALLVVDRPGPGGSPREPARPCDGCDAPCMEALEHALDDGGDGDEVGDVEETWRRWVAVRDACPVGRDHRYSDEQIRYHYEKDRTFLERLVAQSNGDDQVNREASR